MSCLLVQTLVIDKSLPQILQQYIVQLCIALKKCLTLHFSYNIENVQISGLQ